MKDIGVKGTEEVTEERVEMIGIMTEIEGEVEVVEVKVVKAGVQI